MAAPERAILPPGDAQQRPGIDAQPAYPELSRLAALHHEASVTAHLANVLGRAPYAAAAFVCFAGVAAALALPSMPSPQIIVWLMLILLGAGALARAFGAAIRAPFERKPLSCFAEDFKAILLYAGFAWGAGTFLVLPDHAGPFAAFAFIAGPAIALSIFMRARPLTILFAAPATLLGIAAVSARGLPAGALASLLSLTAMLGIAAASALLLRREETAQALWAQQSL